MYSPVSNNREGCPTDNLNINKRGVGGGAGGVWKLGGPNKKGVSDKKSKNEWAGGGGYYLAFIRTWRV